MVLNIHFKVKNGCHISCSPIIKNKIRKTNEINGNWLPKNKWSDFKTYKVQIKIKDLKIIFQPS